MMSNYECALDGTQLSSLDESICILDIREDAPTMRVTTLPLAGGGQRLLNHVWESLSVRVAFAIQEADAARRCEIFSAILAWAESGGTLTISTRPEQQLQVVCTAMPALHTEDWTEALHLTFTTTCIPYWESAEPVAFNLTDTSVISVPGNTVTALSALMVVNNGASPLTNLTISCASTQMVFDGMALPAGGLFTLRQLENIVYAEADYADALQYRTADSDDLLLLPCGTECPVSIAADQPVTASIAVRGRYL